VAADQDLKFKTLLLPLSTWGRGKGIPAAPARGVSASHNRSNFEVVGANEIDEHVEATQLAEVESMLKRGGLMGNPFRGVVGFGAECADQG